MKSSTFELHLSLPLVNWSPFFFMNPIPFHGDHRHTIYRKQWFLCQLNAECLKIHIGNQLHERILARVESSKTQLRLKFASPSRKNIFTRFFSEKAKISG